MSQKKTEINVNDLLDQLDNNKRTTKDSTQGKQKKADDWDHDEDQYVFTVSKNDQASGKPKTSKKKVQVKGWGDYEAEHNEPKEEAPAKNEFTEVVEPKKKIFKKPTGETKPTVDVKVSEEYFPSLGEEPKNIPKKEPEQQQPQPAQTTTTSGPKRFLNSKKEAQGEHFKPIEIKEKEPPVPKPHQPVIQRATEKPQEKKEEPPVEGKIKFGGEGPKKFIGVKTHKEEQKTEADLLREQKEREIEEKLRREREELAKEIEAKKAKKAAFGDKKPEESKNRPKGDGHHHDKPHHDKPHSEKSHPEKSEHQENGEHKKKFTNSKKAHHEEHEKPKQKEEEPKAEEVVVKAHETKEVITCASQKGWGEGGIIKKPPKKT